MLNVYWYSKRSLHFGRGLVQRNAGQWVVLVRTHDRHTRPSARGVERFLHHRRRRFVPVLLTSGKVCVLTKFWVTATVSSRFKTACIQNAGTSIVSPGCCTYIIISSSYFSLRPKKKKKKQKKTEEEERYKNRRETPFIGGGSGLNSAGIASKKRCRTLANIDIKPWMISHRARFFLKRPDGIPRFLLLICCGLFAHIHRTTARFSST